MKHRDEAPENGTLYVVLLAIVSIGLGLPIFILIQSPGTVDVLRWIHWTERSLELGPFEAYSVFARDYPPFSFLYLFLFGKLGQFLKVDVFWSVKLSILSFYAACFLCYVWSFGLLTVNKSAVRWLEGCALYFAAISIAINSIGLGYLDIFFAPFLIASFTLMFKRHHFWAGLFVAISFLSKYQPPILLPFLVVAVFRLAGSWRGGLRASIQYCAGMATILVVVSGALAIFGGLDGLAYSLARALSHPYLSGNALNLNWLVTFALHVVAPNEYGGLTDGASDPISSRISWLLAVNGLALALVYLAVLWGIIRRGVVRPKDVLIGAIAVYGGYFTLAFGVHENHLFLAVLLAMILVAIERTRGPLCLFLILNTLAVMNLMLFYGVSGAPLFDRTFGAIDVSVPMAAAYVILAATFVIWHLRSALSSARTSPQASSRQHTGGS